MKLLTYGAEGALISESREARRMQRRTSFLICLGCTVVIGLIAHMYFYTSNAFSHDSMKVFSVDDRWQISLGRFGMPLWRAIRGYFNVPWLIGVCTMLFSACASWLVVDLLHVRKPMMIALICGIIMANPAVAIQTATYVSWVDIYMLALLLAFLSIWCVENLRLGWLIGVVPLMLSVSLYGAYFAAACALAMMVFVDKLLAKENHFKEVWHFTVKALVMMLGGLALYALTLRAVLTATGITMSGSYNGLQGVGDYTDVSVGTLIGGTYQYVMQLLCQPAAMNRTMVVACSAILAGCAVVQLVLALMQTCKSVRGRVLAGGLLAVVCAVLPFAANITYFISKGMMHSLMTMPIYLIYLFALLPCKWYAPQQMAEDTAEAKERAKLCGAAALRGISMLCVVVLLWDSVVWSNALYLKKRVEWDATTSFMARVMDRIECYPGYVPGETKVALLGSPEDNPAYQVKRAGFDTGDLKTTGVVGAGASLAVTYASTYSVYLRDLEGNNIRFANAEQVTALAQDEGIIAMPLYPAEDSLTMVDDVLCVKLGSL